jgi:hypothetical protein
MKSHIIVLIIEIIIILVTENGLQYKTCCFILCINKTKSTYWKTFNWWIVWIETQERCAYVVFRLYQRQSKESVLLRVTSW